MCPGANAWRHRAWRLRDVLLINVSGVVLFVRARARQDRVNAFIRRHAELVVGHRELLQEENNLGRNSLVLYPFPRRGRRSLERRKVRYCYDP